MKTYSLTPTLSLMSISFIGWLRSDMATTDYAQNALIRSQIHSNPSPKGQKTTHLFAQKELFPFPQRGSSVARNGANVKIERSFS